ncbi:DUF1499 domain-containing protein [Roseibium sp.]|uniref:DUF1499 domain-containing protein n=1 Tax=Roseibium sp. TaxID=1936156 RepID=UPI003A97B52C
MKRYPLYRSKAARVSRRVGAIALPVALMAVLFHRIGGLTADQMILAILTATAIGLAAILLAGTALVHLWKRGGRGTLDAVVGTFYGLVALLPVGALGASQVLQGNALDVTTDPVDPPSIVAIAAPGAPGRQDMPVLPLMERLATVAPEHDNSDIVSRRYRIQPAVLHVAALAAASRSGWKVVAEVPPDLLDAPTSFQGEVRSPILGLVDDVAVRIRPDPVGALFDIRSVSRYPLQDLGSNAGRIRAFYREMDEVLLQTYGDVESLTVLEEETEIEAAGLQPAEPLEEVPVIPVPAFKPYVEGSDEPVAEDLSVIEE